MWKWFTWQQPAVDFLSTLDRGVYGLFVYHKFGGEKQYAVASYKCFAQIYLLIERSDCHFSEMVTPSVTTKLYLEVDTSNQGQQTQLQNRLKCLIRFVNHFLMVQFKCHQSIRKKPTSYSLHQQSLYSSTYFRF